MALRSSGARLLLFVVAVALVALGGGWLALHQAEVLVGRALSIVLGPGEIAHRSIALDRNGHVVVEDLVFRPGGQDEVRAERVQVETPGWSWFLSNGLDPELRDSRLDRLRVSLSGVHLGSAAASPLKELGVFGAVSASPWADEGCLQKVHWTAEKLAEAGLAPGDTVLQFVYRAQAGDLLATTTLETYGVSRLQWTRIGTLPGGQSNMLLLAADAGLTRSEHWEVQDQGFVAARNRYCASNDQVDPRRLVGRHVESVARRLAMLGLEVDGDTRGRYRRFALAGGKLSLSVAYPRPLTAAALMKLRESAAWSETIATLARNDDSGALRWRRIAPMPLTGLAPGVSTYSALQQERASAPRADALEAVPDESEPSTTDAAIAAAPSPATEETPVDTPVEAPVETPVDAPATSPVTPAAPEAAGPVSEPPPRHSLAVPATTSRGPLPAIPPLTHFVRPTPVSATRAEITARDVPTRRAAPEPKTLRWDELRALRGQTIEIWTMHSPQRRVQILEFNDDSLRVSYRIGNNGEATFSIKREGFLRAVLKS